MAFLDDPFPQLNTAVGAYAQLGPPRVHIFLMRLDGLQRARRLSGGAMYRHAVDDSGWHGLHNYSLGCSTFQIYNFSYRGVRANRAHNVHFYLEHWASAFGIQQYWGCKIDQRDNSALGNRAGHCLGLEQSRRRHGCIGTRVPSSPWRLKWCGIA